LKFCGGCNPSYDRVEYVRKIRRAAGDRIEWVGLDRGRFSALLLVSGCERQCVELAQGERGGCRVTCIKDNHRDPSEILSDLLKEGGKP